MVSLIWAQDVNGIIGDGAKMLWRVPADMKHFKESTLDSPVIMGRKSYEAIGAALPRRTNVVVTGDRQFAPADALVAHSVEEALVLARKEGAKTGATHLWVIGGGQIYEQTIGLADELIVSELDLDVSQNIEKDTAVYAPKIDLARWEIDSDRSDSAVREPSNGVEWRLVVYRRPARKSTTSE